MSISALWRTHGMQLICKGRCAPRMIIMMVFVHARAHGCGRPEAWHLAMPAICWLRSQALRSQRFSQHNRDPHNSIKTCRVAPSAAFAQQQTPPDRPLPPPDEEAAAGESVAETGLAVPVALVW